MRSFGIRDVHEYYSRDDIQEALLSFSRDREVVGVFRNGSYSTRPNVIIYPNDIIAMVREGSLEFHSSIERWSQPMNIRTDNYDQLRTGWDMILDLDCRAFEHGRVAAQVFCRALEMHGIENYSLKFTGGKGFHIGIPWESFPEQIEGKPLLGMFPSLPRSMGLYLREFVREDFEGALLKLGTQEQLAEQAGLEIGELEPEEEGEMSMNPFRLVDVDTVLLSPRHLFRMPYSLNKGSFLVSLPLSPGELPGFRREQAEPDAVKAGRRFFEKHRPGEALPLVLEAMDWSQRLRREQARRLRERPSYAETVPEEHFPPCVRLISQGLADGRKRSVFILATFLRRMNWKWDHVEAFAAKWNQRNRPPLPENYMRSQLRWHRQQKREILPPACAREGWYASFGACRPDGHCGFQKKTVKNPVNYPFRSMGKRRGFKSERKKSTRKG